MAFAGARIEIQRFVQSGCVFAAALVAACGETSSSAAATDVFRVVKSITLEETSEDPIVALTSMTVSPAGDLIIVDGPAARIRQFGTEGQSAGALGRPGKGPGELTDPTAVTVSGDSLLVVERGSPRLTVFHWDTVARVVRLPGQYGFWIESAADHVIAGVGTQNERFAVLDRDGAVRARFGIRDPAIQETPYWVFFVRDRAVRLDDHLIVSSSFSPLLRSFTLDGDSVGTFGTAPPSWIQPMPPPPVDDLDAQSRTRAITSWSGSFSVITQVAVVADSLIVVAYGRYDPTEADPYHTIHETIDVYSASGEKLHEDIKFSTPILSGGDQLYVVSGTPPDGWTISALEYAGQRVP